ncbi:MAG: MoaD/ThiS family protein [Desulfobacterales bacterium]
MKITVKCFSSLADADTCDYKDSTPYELEDGETVMALIKRLNQSPEKIKIVFVNGKNAETNSVLKDGDQVGLAPASGGM